MTCRLRLPLLIAAAVLVPAGASQACWCSRAYTRSYFNPCATCPTVNRSCYIPVAACPTTSCSTNTVERCYYEPNIVYQARTVLRPQIGLVRRSYYDPITCCYRSYWLPETQSVERSYQVPVTTWTKRCTTEPETACTTTYAHSATYWSPDGHRFYPVAPPSSSCPVPDSNGPTNRESSYGPPESQKSNGKTSDPPNVPEPRPMPSRPKSDATKTIPPSPKSVAYRPASAATSRTASSFVYRVPGPVERRGP